MKKSQEKANELYQKAADLGDEVAMRNLAINYEYGNGLPKDRAKAIEWYKKSAEKGDEDAQKALKGLGVK